MVQDEDEFAANVDDFRPRRSDQGLDHPRRQTVSQFGFHPPSFTDNSIVSDGLDHFYGKTSTSFDAFLYDESFSLSSSQPLRDLCSCSSDGNRSPDSHTPFHLNSYHHGSLALSTLTTASSQDIEGSSSESSRGFPDLNPPKAINDMNCYFTDFTSPAQLPHDAFPPRDEIRNFLDTIFPLDTSRINDVTMEYADYNLDIQAHNHPVNSFNSNSGLDGHNQVSLPLSHNYGIALEDYKEYDYGNSFLDSTQLVYSTLDVPSYSPFLDSPFGSRPSSPRFVLAPNESSDYDDAISRPPMLSFQSGLFPVQHPSSKHELEQEDTQIICYTCSEFVSQGFAIACDEPVCDNRAHVQCLGLVEWHKIGNLCYCDECYENDPGHDSDTKALVDQHAVRNRATQANFARAVTLSRPVKTAMKQHRSNAGRQPKTPTKRDRFKSSPTKSSPVASSGSLTPKNQRPSAWTEDEAKICIEEMKAAKASGRYARVDELWEAVSKNMKARGVFRSPHAVKNVWNRELRAKSGFDERARPNPKNMRTGLLASSKRAKSDATQGPNAG